MQRMIWIVCLTAVLALASQSARADDLLLLGTSTDAATMTLAYQGDGDTVLVHGGWGGRGWGGGWGRGWGGYGWGGYGWGGYGYGWGGYGWGGYGLAGYYGYPYYASYGSSYPTYYYSSGCGCSSPYVGSYYSAPAYYYGYSSTPASYYSYQPAAVVIAPLAQSQPQQNGTVVSSPGATGIYVQQAAYQPTASAVAPSAAVPVIAPLQVVPPAGFEYDGGPASPVPMPGGERVIPQKKNTDLLKDVHFQAPHSNSSKFVYSAYGEQAKPVVEMPAATTLTSQTMDL
jgi:hypothetical protein